MKSGKIITICGLLPMLVAFVLGASAAVAQTTWQTYRCSDGTEFIVGFFAFWWDFIVGDSTAGTRDASGNIVDARIAMPCLLLSCRQIQSSGRSDSNIQHGGKNSRTQGNADMAYQAPVDDIVFTLKTAVGFVPRTRWSRTFHLIR